MMELPEDLQQLLDAEAAPDPRDSPTPDEQLIHDVAHLLYPLTPHPSPRDTEARMTFIRRARRQVAREAFSGGDDVLMDQLRALRQEQQEVTRRISTLLAYARTTPPEGRTYRLRDLSEATGLPISSIRDRITNESLDAIERLDLDDRRARQLAAKRAAPKRP